LASYSVVIKRSAEKELAVVEKHILPSIWGNIKVLALEPRPRGSIKLKGMEMSYRLRVRAYRIIYRIDDKQKIVTVVGVKHRREAY
jgi:mRNA interferase RelE/StbE